MYSEQLGAAFAVRHSVKMKSVSLETEVDSITFITQIWTLTIVLNEHSGRWHRANSSYRGIVSARLQRVRAVDLKLNNISSSSLLTQ